MQQAAVPCTPPHDATAAEDAPPKQVAQALERLGQAGRLIADVRLGADRLLEALFFVAAEQHHQHSSKCLNLILREESLMRQHLQSLRAIGELLSTSCLILMVLGLQKMPALFIQAPLDTRACIILRKCDSQNGTENTLTMANLSLLSWAQQGFFDCWVPAAEKQLEESGVLNDSLRLRSNSWGLHMPLVCPDGAVVAYAWKRQLAGQAGASAVDRTRLALKAFTDQKRRFFPHLADDSVVESSAKKHCSLLAMNSKEELDDQRTVKDILSHLEKEVPNLQTFTYQRLDWLKRASCLTSASNEDSKESSKGRSFPNTSKLRQESTSNHAAEKAAVIELLLPSVFRAVVSLYTAGSMDPDAVAFFSPDEGGRNLHALGLSSHHVFKHVSEHASTALQYFICVNPEKALHSLLHWICGFQTLFTKVCSKCGKLLSMDKQSGLVLPPVIRPFRYLSDGRNISKSSSVENRQVDLVQAFHLSCFSEEA